MCIVFAGNHRIYFDVIENDKPQAGSLVAFFAQVQALGLCDAGIGRGCACGRGRFGRMHAIFARPTQRNVLCSLLCGRFGIFRGTATLYFKMGRFATGFGAFYVNFVAYIEKSRSVPREFFEEVKKVGFGVAQSGESGIYATKFRFFMWNR